VTNSTAQGSNPLEAWQNAAASIRDAGGELFNLLVTIDRPGLIDIEWLTVYNPRRFGGTDDVRDVINTIFPMKIASAHLRREFYTRYLQLYDRGKRRTRNRSAWGTYFARLIAFGPSGLNQLETAIEKLKAWEKRSTTALVFHLSSPELDAPRTRGGPCWHFGELIWRPDESIDLVVVYRNHDYFNKALGNFLALGQLLEFICAASNKNPAG
jgi:hypothetical protein